MKIKIVKQMVSNDPRYKWGHTSDFPEKEATRLIASGVAELAEEPKKPAAKKASTAKPKGTKK